MVNQFQGIGSMGAQPYYGSLGASPMNGFQTPKPLYDPSLPNGDCLQKVNGEASALQYRLNPNSRAVLFDSNEDIFYIVTSDASGTNTVQAFSFAPYEKAKAPKEQYVTIEEFNRFKEEVLHGQQSIRNTSVPAKAQSAGYEPN